MSSQYPVVQPLTHPVERGKNRYMVSQRAGQCTEQIICPLYLPRSPNPLEVIRHPERKHDSFFQKSLCVLQTSNIIPAATSVANQHHMTLRPYLGNYYLKECCVIRQCILFKWQLLSLISCSHFYISKVYSGWPIFNHYSYQCTLGLVWRISLSKVSTKSLS